MTSGPLLSPAPAATSRRLARVALLMSLAASLAACGGGGSDGSTAPAPPPSSGPVTISGKAVFESVPASSSGLGLNYAASADKPIRGATVQLLDAGNAVVATTTTDALGNYSVVLANSQPVTVRVRAEIKRTGSASGDRDFAVLDNTSGGALYVLDSAAFAPTADATQNLRAASGWNGSSYASPRAAAPFSILDVVYDAQAKIASAAPTLNLPALKLFWSVNNKTVDGQVADGNIGTSFFTTTGGRALYILGQANVDTDEYDTHVVAHEFGHYLQSAVSRDDSVGGSHGSKQKLDMRVAFSEGWGNAWSGIALGNPLYSDSFGANQARNFSINVSIAATGADRGWYSEASAQYLIWATNQSTGFTPVYTALTRLAASPAWTSLYSFAEAVKIAAPASAPTITSLWASQDVVAQDAFGSGETNNGGNPLNLPVYKTHAVGLGIAQNYCVHADADSGNDGNKLGEFVYIRFTAAGSRTLTVTKTSPAGVLTDPDFTLLKVDGTKVIANSLVDDVETLSNVTLPTGSHVIALSDFKLRSPNTSCFDFKVN